MEKLLKYVIPDFTEAIYETHSGEESLNSYVKPLLENANSFFRVSSFFTPSAIRKVFSELSACMQKGGEIKFVIGIHDTEKLIPILDKIESRNSNSRFVAAVEALIVGEMENLIDEIENNDEFLIVLAELVYQKYIEIKIASVRKDYESYLKTNRWPRDQGIFHAKTSIIKQGDETVLIGGTINFSNQGYGDNVEDVVILGSWFSPNACEKAEKQFNEIWTNEHKDVYTLDFNQSIRKVINLISRKSEKIRNNLNSRMKIPFKTNQLLFLIQNSPLFYHYSFQNVKLLPHQFEVYRALLSRWPIYGLVSDEVGLGKTIEAGAIIKYLSKFCNVKRSALLVPSSLRYQWQREMFNLFGLKFYVYEHQSKSLVFSPNNEAADRINYVGQGDYFEHGVNGIIFSWHYLRLRGANGQYRLNETDKIDLLLVDEAHGARVTESLTSDQKSTQLHQFLSHLLPSVKHKLLLTATPYQTSLLDYHSIISLLMQNDEIETRSFERISRINSGYGLNTQQKITAMLELIEYNTYRPIGPFDQLSKDDLPSLVNAYSDGLYTLNHPTTIFTIRNTRDKLKEIGYNFPNTSISSSPIALNTKQQRIFTRVNEYIENQLFNFETVVKGSSTGLGFVKTIYQQRIVSSFQACSDTLNSRLNKLQVNLKNGYVEGELIEIDGYDDDSMGSISLYERIELTEAHIDAAKTEINFINEILTSIQNVLITELKLLDPKIERAIEIIGQHLEQNDTIILFSRFTSTTNFLVERIKQMNQFNFGRYQGDSKEIFINQEAFPFDRQTLSDKFSNGDFPVIICSDAASEGLNLQKANVLINVDVPWNPARLLQRFGRIDRFGQKKNELYLYNLYYPDTIEDRIYTRLIDRNLGFRQILGTTPEITSRDHLQDLDKREIREIEADTEFLYKNSLLNLTAKDNNRIHDLLLAKLTANEKILLFNFTKDTRNVIKEGIIEMDTIKHRFSTDEMDEDYLDLNHPFLKRLPTTYSKNERTLFSLKNKQGFLLMYCIVIDELAYPLFSIDELLDYLVLGIPIQKEKLSFSFNTNNLSAGFLELIKVDGNQFIFHNFVNFNNHQSEMYDDLYLEESDIKICMN